MKKLLAILLAAVLCLALVACSGSDPETKDEKKETKQTTAANDDPTAEGDDEEVIADDEEAVVDDEEVIADDEEVVVDDDVLYSVEDINDLLYLTGVIYGEEVEYGVCAECGNDADAAYVICDDCAEMVDECMYCNEELGDDDYVMHQDCVTEFAAYLEEISEIEGTEEEAGYSVEDINALLYQTSVVAGEELEYGVCGECGNDTADAAYVICDDCAEMIDECMYCNEELGDDDYLMHQDCVAAYAEFLSAY